MSPESHSTTAHSPEHRALAMLCRQITASQTGSVLVAAVTSAALWQAIDQRLIIGWFSVLALTALARVDLANHFLRTERFSAATRRWLVAGAMASGAIWGALAAVLLLTTSPEHHAFVVIVLTGVSAASLITNSSVLAVFTAFVIPAIAPATVILFARGSVTDVALGTMFLIYAGLMVSSSRAYRGVLDELFTLGDENERLVGSLFRTKAELEASLARVEDLNEQHRETIRELELAKHRAEAGDRSKTAFLSTLSHEVRTPLNAILGMTELLAESNLQPVQRQQLAVCARAGGHLLGQLDDVLEVARIEGGDQAPEPALFSVKALVEKVAALARTRSGKQPKSVAVDLCPDVPLHVVGDMKRIRVVLGALVSEAAAKVDGPAPAIRVTARAGDDGPIRLSFEISASGSEGADEPGPTQAGDAPAQTRLGVELVRRIVDSISGSLDERTGPDGAASYVLSVPVERAAVVLTGAKVPREPSIEAAPAFDRPMRILLVDDSIDNRLVIEAFFKQEPVEVATAEDGCEGVRRFIEDTPYDLVIMDIHMPKMDGFQATRSIRAYESEVRRRPVPIIALSADALTATGPQALEAGCDRYLTKPIRKQTLLENVYAIIGWNGDGESARPFSPRINSD